MEKAISAGRHRNGYEIYVWPIDIAAQCQSCAHPVCTVATNADARARDHYKPFCDENEKKLIGPGDVQSLGFSYGAVWPTKPAPEVPAHVPPAIERAMLQAEKNYPIIGNEEASAMMYRRALELTLGDLHSGLTGTLAARIKKLVKDKVLPEAMGAWADEIRELGNEAAHDPTEVSRDELRMIRGFTDATLRYLYTLPAEVAARRKTPANA